VLPLVLAAALAAAPAAAPAAELSRSAPAAPGLAPETRLAQEDWDSGSWDDDEDERPPRIRLTLWGGEALGEAGSGSGSGFYGAEAAWAFRRIDLGVLGTQYRNVPDATRTWTPVVLARLTQRFKTRRGVEAAFGFGVGAGRPRGWTTWYQVTLGVRVPLGPLFLAGELGFESQDLLRLGAGLGVAFF
jgi:hypothetical protein